MNRIASVTLGCLITWMVSASYSQEQVDRASAAYFSEYESHKKADGSRVERAYIDALKSENDGVLESALAHITRMKLYMPCGACDEMHERIHSLAVAGRTPSIRFRAYLADLVLDSPELFTREQQMDYKDPEEMFSALSMRLQTSLLSYGNRKYVRAQ